MPGAQGHLRSFTPSGLLGQVVTSFRMKSRSNIVALVAHKSCSKHLQSS